MSFRELELTGSYSDKDDRLNRFFVPVLSESVAYDRISGYWTSSSLSSVARGLSRMIANGGKMRLIAGAQLNDADVAAIEAGEPLDDVLARALLHDPLEGASVITEHRLETLAWLTREGLLDIKIGVPTDHLGRPLRRNETDRYFHSKYGVFTDVEGNRIAFMGSNNESASGVIQNHETFSVFPSWIPEVWTWNGQGVVDDFEAHWHGHPDAGWKIVSLPEAVKDRLIDRVKGKPGPPPEKDPEEASGLGTAAEDELLRYVAVAPRLYGGTGVGLVTAGVDPWPHQGAIARRLVESYPRSYLLADEVGLGKTIEAGLAVRELLLSGGAGRILLLVPASVIKQWQEELDEKLSLRIPRLDGGRYYHRRGGIDEEAFPKETPANKWTAFPVMLASSHLARRRAERRAVVEAGPWDVVFVDEAHHAGRRGSKPTDTPNALLRLLEDMRDAGSWRTLYLASATPMQMHAHEAWDLLDLLRLTPLWGESAESFVHYYTGLREFFPDRDWRFLQRMSADFFSDEGVSVDEILEKQVKAELGLATSSQVRKFADLGLTSESAEHMSTEARGWMDEWLRRHTPTQDRVFRTTRRMLRHYKEQGILPASTVIPQREVTDRFVQMREDEKDLYDKIEEYISRYYDLYLSGPGSTKPLGFIMTVYRRRLTSSFLAIERSLQRRREVLLGKASAEALLDPDDLAAIEFSLLFDTDELPEIGKNLAAEVAEIDTFLALLSKRPPDESKMQYLHSELDDAFKGGHSTAIVFTQYGDTMNYLRERLLQFYGTKIACWSGNGGERWDPEADDWVQVPKTEIKRLFREGNEVKILIGTDSMSEGLNLQTCALMFNYDMPWNFMRVEQRIGRVDRIGGQPRVEIKNYFYSGTVEEQIYAGIKEDYDWFTDIVGPAQPVLGQVEGIIEQIAMTTPGDARSEVVKAKIESIREAIEEAKARAVTLDDVGRGADPSAPHIQPAIDLNGLERVLLSASKTKVFFHEHPMVRGAFLLELPKGKAEVTFRRKVADENSPDIRLLTYGTDEFAQLIEQAGIATERSDEYAPKTLSELEGNLQGLNT